MFVVKGLVMQSGTCSGNDISTHSATPAQDCETLCAKNSLCTGFVYTLLGECTLKNAKCTTITPAVDTYYFEWSDSKYRFTMRAGVCDSSNFVRKEDVSLDGCMIYVMQRQHQYMEAVTYFPTTRLCYTVDRKCSVSLNPPLPTLSFNFLGITKHNNT